LAANPEPGRRGGAGPTAGPAAPTDPDADNYYQLLGVPYTATGAEITRAYRAAMKRVHPDRQRADRPEGARAAAEEQAKRLNRAYATLSKPIRRQAYDRTIRGQVVQDQIMSRYVGGFYVPQANGHDPFAHHLRRERTAAERRERAEADRDALVSLVVVFGGVTLAVLAALILWAAARALLGAAF
jgi:curved DNA-binding protein CbpA